MNGSLRTKERKNNQDNQRHSIQSENIRYSCEKMNVVKFSCAYEAYTNEKYTNYLTKCIKVSQKIGKTYLRIIVKEPPE